LCRLIDWRTGTKMSSEKGRKHPSYTNMKSKSILRYHLVSVLNKAIK
jgi:hypothetical protein